MNREELQSAVAAVPYWYHKITLPHGIKTPGYAPIDAAAYGIPDDMTGKLVLDVGAWDGYWTIEAVKRGALHVVAIDDFSDSIGADTNADRSPKWHTLQLCCRALGIRNVSTVEADIQNTRDFPAGFIVDHVFCFGVLYHLRHPLLGLENMRRMCKGTIHIETAILDGCQSVYTKTCYISDDCCFEFYPHDEYGMNHSNWWVGTLKAWCGLIEAAGFKNIESWKLTENPTHVSEARGFIRATV